MIVERYDFCKPVPFAVDLEQSIVEWMRDACELAPRNWNKHLSFPVEIDFKGLEVMQLSTALTRLQDPAAGFRVPIQEAAATTLLVFPRPLMIALVTGLLGEPCRELPQDRDLTIVEDSLAEFLVEDQWLSAVLETWSGSDPIHMGPIKKELHPKYTRIFPVDDNLAVCTFILQGPFGKQECQWLTPQKGYLELFAATGLGREVQKESDVRPQLEALVRELPVEVSVQLGAVDLPVSQLTKLRPGDVLILNQRVAEPLTALVADEKKFRVWPGRVGSRPAFQIDSQIGD